MVPALLSRFYSGLFLFCFVNGLYNQKPITLTKTNLKTARIVAPSVSPTASSGTIFQLQSPRVQRLKEVSLQRDVLRDITAAEFAVRIEVKENNATTIIDYDMLISKLDDNLDMLVKRGGDSKLINRIIETKESLLDVKHGRPKPTKVDEANTPAVVADESIIDAKVKELRESLRLVVREDGTVDWDGAVASGKEVAKFGTELWERLNGKEEEMPSIGDLFGQMEAKVPDTEEITKLVNIVADAQGNLNEEIVARDDLKFRLRERKKDGKLITAEDVKMLRQLDLRVKELEKRLRLFSLDLDMERICVYLLQEIETSLDTSEQRLFVAQIALVDKQLNSMLSGLRLGSDSTASVSYLYASEKSTDFISLIDDDELNLIYREVSDLQSRLGIGGSQMRSSMDWGTLGVIVSEGGEKLREGFTFYSEGVKLLAGDIAYAWQLLLRAAGGYTLKPREVNAVRRLGFDILSFIPFTIILVIPLTPVGHVLAFNFIQRFYPDFFPSCFTEKRANLRRLFAEIERKSMDDIIGVEPSWSSKLPVPLFAAFLLGITVIAVVG